MGDGYEMPEVDLPISMGNRSLFNLFYNAPPNDSMAKPYSFNNQDKSKESLNIAEYLPPGTNNSAIQQELITNILNQNTQLSDNLKQKGKEVNEKSNLDSKNNMSSLLLQMFQNNKIDPWAMEGIDIESLLSNQSLGGY
jgi:hypothetical protein